MLTPNVVYFRAEQKRSLKECMVVYKRTSNTCFVK
jgi:hypothetical protein